MSHIKAKGGVVAKWDGGDFKSNSATIIDKAVVAYLLDDVPIEKTVHECDDIERFQIVAKAGASFQRVIHDIPVICKGDIVGQRVELFVQRCNRVYATTDERYGGISKVKLENDREVGRSKIPLTPEHCFVDNDNEWKSVKMGLTPLDKSWYVTLAKKKAREFITRSKEEREQMAEVDEKTNEIEKPKPTRKAKAKDTAPEIPMTFNQKLLQLQKDMAEVATGVSFDKAITNISHEYADTQQYKMWLGLKCSLLGLIFGFDIHDTEFLGVVAEPTGKQTSYGVQVGGTVKLTDSESDNSETYGVSGIGINVQPGFCLGVAQTNALRNFILNNYLLDNMGREGDDVALNSLESAKTSGGYASPAEKAQMKQGIAAAKAEETKYATDLFAGALYDKIIEAQKHKPTFATAMLKTHYETDGKPKLGENGKSTMEKTVAVAGLTKAEAIIAKAAKGDE